MYIARIALEFGDSWLRKLSCAVAGVLGVAYLAFTVMIVVRWFVGVDWTDVHADAPPLPDSIMLVLGGSAVLMLAGLGVAFMLFQPLLSRLRGLAG